MAVPPQGSKAIFEVLLKTLAIVRYRSIAAKCPDKMRDEKSGQLALF
jgi:hypothetical protein